MGGYPGTTGGALQAPYCFRIVKDACARTSALPLHPNIYRLIVGLLYLNSTPVFIGCHRLLWKVGPHWGTPIADSTMIFRGVQWASL
ncbi:hypothetical protein XENTR_v10013068 [Xenopus tropicalis]|nr:hypothetical protein XENTR_v10013068 [Xenopus tropicalis]